ncbi:unnamed protein product [Linum tenue]|uniref:EDS1 EP domain-containing protein n=1 Tax=Linum tenue TaxID=586396 RepID=A0AAV0NB53_9ROSI|nr:unnamed protein product [Linum tenue]
MLCSEMDSTCVEDPDVVSILFRKWIELAHKATEQLGSLDVDEYGKMVEYLKSRVICRGSSILGRPMADSMQAGIALQLQSIGISLDQKQSTISLATELDKKQKFSSFRKRSALEQSRKLQEIKMKMAYLEWYKKDSRNKGKGYYDSYKIQSTTADIEIAKHKKFLTNYWKDLVEEAESKSQKESLFFRTMFLYGGTNYRRMVEPLDIAEFYREGKNRYYKKQGRSPHYVLLEKWQKEDAAGKGKMKKKEKKPVDMMTEDSCFWADVEEALFAVRLLKQKGSGGGGESSEAKNRLVEFQRYVMEQIENYAVDSEIFLRESSYMVWWKEFQEVVAIVGSGSSSLVEYMKSGRYLSYGSP